MSVEQLKARADELRASQQRGGDQDISSELETLKRKLAAREGQPGYGQNVEALRERIAQLQGETK